MKKNKILLANGLIAGSIAGALFCQGTLTLAGKPVAPVGLTVAVAILIAGIVLRILPEVQK